MRRLFTSLLASAVAGSALAACAPRIQQTHYERWAQQDQKRRDERMAEEAAEAAAKSSAPPPGTMPKAAPPPVAPVVRPPPPPPSDGYNSFSSPTPPVGTATRSRAIRPEDEDEEIY